MATLRVSPEQAIALLTERIESIKTIPGDANGPGYYDLVKWCSKTWAAIDEIYGSGDPRSEELRTLGLSNCACNSSVQALLLLETYHARLIELIDEIRTAEKNS